MGAELANYRVCKGRDVQFPKILAPILLTEDEDLNHYCIKQSTLRAVWSFN